MNYIILIMNILVFLYCYKLNKTTKDEFKKLIKKEELNLIYGDLFDIKEVIKTIPEINKHLDNINESLSRIKLLIK